MVYNRGLMAYRSVDNRIDLQVRNSDEKKYNITGSTVVFNIINKESRKYLFIILIITTLNYK